MKTDVLSVFHTAHQKKSRRSRQALYALLSPPQPRAQAFTRRHAQAHLVLFVEKQGADGIATPSSSLVIVTKIGRRFDVPRWRFPIATPNPHSSSIARSLGLSPNAIMR